MIERFGLFAASALAITAAAAPAGAVTFLSAGATSACAASSCFSKNKTYTITWSAADFAGGRVGIQQLKLDRNVLGDKQDLVFKVGFQLAGGGDVGEWGAFMIAGLSGDTVNIFGPGFTWDTYKGDLVMTLSLIQPGIGAGGGGMIPGGWRDEPFEGGDPGRVAADDEGGPMHDVVDASLLRAPTPSLQPSAASAAVPEPQAWAMMLLGFGVAGGLLRNRRRHRESIAA